MLISNLKNNVRDVLLVPKEFWSDQKNIEYGTWQLFTTYYIVLVFVASFATFLGAWFGSTHFYVGFALLKALREFILFSLMYFISVLVINQLLPVYDTAKNLAVVRKLVVYSMTPYLLVSVVTGLFPALYILDALGIYGAYLYWTGSETLLELPQRNHTGFVLVSVLICLFIYAIFSILLWKIFVAYY